jgi:hypothetical protein
MTTTELKSKLDSFKRFYQIHQYKSVGEYHLYLSDGLKYLHEYYDIGWLLDIIFDFLQQSKWHPANYTMWTLERQPCGLVDLKGKTLYGKLLYEQYDISEPFPFDEFTLYNDWHQACLPSEV